MLAQALMLLAGVVTCIIISGKRSQRFFFEAASMPQPPLSSSIGMIDVECFNWGKLKSQSLLMTLNFN